MSKKVLNIIEGAAIVVLGVLVAVFGGIQTLSTYFGILFIIAAAGILALGIVALVKTKITTYPVIFFAAALLTIGVVLLIHAEYFDLLIRFVAYLLFAAGCALVVYGVYTIVKFSVFYGIGQIVVGASVAALALCYLLIPAFAVVFWIVVGILIGVYGILFIVAAILDKEILKKAE